jgi:DNA-binding SARP family transcriptional activator
VSTDLNVAPPNRLETLGTLSLKGSVTSVNAADQRQQRRRLALLAILAASDKLGRSRDQLLLLLWPESTEKKARHSLDQLLYAIRSSLGDSIFAGINPLRLNSSVISADVIEFERFLDEGNSSAAVELYRGSFLDGFYLSDAKEFEDWVETERRRLSSRYSQALEHLALEAERCGDHLAAIRWRQKLVDADPVSSRYAMAMATALVNAGDYAAAVAFADRYERTATRELGTGSALDIRKVVRELGEQSHPMRVATSTSQGTVSTKLDGFPPPPITPSAFSSGNSTPDRPIRTRLLALSIFLPVAILVAAIAGWKYFPRASVDTGTGSVNRHATPSRTTNTALNAARRDTHNIEAYELYVRGHDPVLLRNDSAARRGLDYFIKATELDSNFAGGYAGLAEMYARQAMGNKPVLPRNVLRQKAETAARKAISLDDSLAEGHAALGLVDSYWRRDLNEAEKELERAVALDSSAPHALEYLAMTHAMLGKNSDAVSDARSAVGLDPLSPTARATYAQMLYVVGRCDEALPILDSVNAMKSPPLRIADARSICYDTQHRWSEAQAAVRKQAADGGVHAMALIGLALGLSGHKREALEVRSKIASISQASPAYYELAIVNYGLGNIDDTFADLDRSLSTGAHFYELLGPVFDSLHRDPRFKALTRPQEMRVSGR